MNDYSGNISGLFVRLCEEWKTCPNIRIRMRIHEVLKTTIQIQMLPNIVFGCSGIRIPNRNTISLSIALAIKGVVRDINQILKNNERW